MSESNGFFKPFPQSRKIYVPGKIFPDLKVGDTFPGRERILAKIDLVRKYFKDNFDVEIDELRDAVLRRQKDVIEGKVDLTSLEIK